MFDIIKRIQKFFLNLCKAYDALNMEGCLEILWGYGVILLTERILYYYWERLLMVTRAGHYYGTPFKGNRGVIQGDTISPTIFNMVANAAIWHWNKMVVGEEAGLHGFRQAIQWLTALFYANDGLLASPKLDRLQAAMYVLTGLFNRVGHQTNVEKSCDVKFT